MEYIDLINKRREICNHYNNNLKDDDDFECAESCPLSYENNGKNTACGSFILNFPEEAQEVISNWKKPIDWSTIPIDTKILVRDTEGSKWVRAYFAGYKDGKIYAFDSGATSWTVYKDFYLSTPWKYAKLYKEE